MTDDRFEEYRGNAAEAERQAFRARLGEEREAYLRIARGWRDLIESATREIGSVQEAKRG